MAPPRPSTALIGIGTVLNGTYRIERLLGEGGMGAVYVASHVRLPKQYAIKVLHSHALQDADDKVRFKQEAEIASHLHHPHIVEVHDFNETKGGQPYIVMELLEGRDLADLIHAEKRLSPSRTMAIVRPAAEALAAAHARGVVHRDLKPSNLFLAERAGRETVKVLDFGISKRLEGAEVRTLTSQLMGTPAYMSPEQARGRHAEVDARSDQFSFAAIVYEMLGGRRAFAAGDDESVFDVLEQVVHADPPPIDGQPAAVQAVVKKALSKARDDRYPSVAAFVDALDAALASGQRAGAGPGSDGAGVAHMPIVEVGGRAAAKGRGEDTSTGRVPERVDRAAGRGVRWAAVIAVVAVGLALGAGLLLRKGGEQSAATQPPVSEAAPVAPPTTTSAPTVAPPAMAAPSLPTTAPPPPTAQPPTATSPPAPAADAAHQPASGAARGKSVKKARSGEDDDLENPFPRRGGRPTGQPR